MKQIILSCLIGSAVLALLSPSLRAQGLFSAKETSLDLGLYYGSRDKDGDNDEAWGPAVGFNYFFTENIGVSADTYTDGFRWPYLLNSSAIFRYPLQDSGIAPYGFAGFGRQWNHGSQWTGHIGGGAEYRFRERTGVFGDIRYVFAEREDHAVIRLGIRVIFR